MRDWASFLKWNAGMAEDRPSRDSLGNAGSMKWPIKVF
jgi:hypothetical protein